MSYENCVSYSILQKKKKKSHLYSMEEGFAFMALDTLCFGNTTGCLFFIIVYEQLFIKHIH